MPQLKIPYATTKTQHSQINIQKQMICEMRKSYNGRPRILRSMDWFSGSMNRCCRKEDVKFLSVSALLWEGGTAFSGVPKGDCLIIL